MSLSLPKVNTHIHLPPNFSAFLTVDEAVGQAASEGIEILGASNYYDFSVYEPFAEKAAEKGIMSLFGIEIVCRIESLAKQGVKINDPGNPGKMYLCGKALRSYEHPSPRASELLGVIRSGDEARMSVMTDLLRRVFVQSGIDAVLDAHTIARQVANRHGVSIDTVVLQERHLAQAFQEAFFELVPIEDRAEKLAGLFKASTKIDAPAVQADIRTYLMKAGKPAFVDEKYVSYEEAHELIKELGGLVCYPIVADGMNPISDFEAGPMDLVHRLRDLDISHVEFIPNRNSASVLSEYVEVLHGNGFSLSAGTEHNTTERIPVQPLCKGGVPIPDAAQEFFVRGALLQGEYQNAITARI